MTKGRGQNLATFLLCVMLLAVTACSGKTLTGPITVTDSLGRTVSLAQPARRIIALAPHLVENVYAAGGGEQLIAGVEWSDYPAAAKKLATVGAHNSFSLEAIAALQPDLVLVWASGNGLAVLAQLESLGLPTYVDEISRLDEIGDSLVNLGILSGNRAFAESQARQFKQSLQALRERYAGAAEISVMYQIWHQPLQTLNGEHIIDDLIELCGGRNVFADAVSLAPQVSLEAVIERNPEAIIASGPGGGRPDWLDNWRRWPVLAAVQAENLFYVEPDLLQRHTVRLLEGGEQLCARLEEGRRQRELLEIAAREAAGS